MNALKICKSYFNGFQEVLNFSNLDTTKKALAVLKIISYFTVVIPLGFAGVYSAASLYGRVSIKNDQPKIYGYSNIIELFDEKLNSTTPNEDPSKNETLHSPKLEALPSISPQKDFPSTSSHNSEEYKKKIVENQAKQITYKKSLTPLEEQSRNLPIPLLALPKKVSHYSKNAIFYGYNAEGIRDYGWGCAWRAIQTCLSAYKIQFPFKELFHLFGSFENLKLIYENKYPEKVLANSKVFAPHHLPSGWAEPFIGQMIMHFHGILSALEVVNGLPANCNAPREVFHNEPLSFKDFRVRLVEHFETDHSAPIMIDDGSFALNIVGIQEDGLNITLWIADPHIKEGVNKKIDNEKSPIGLYNVTLNEIGEQKSCSVDADQVSNLCYPGSYNGLYFHNKSWMALFPLKPIN